MMANQKSMQIEMAMKQRQAQMAMQTALAKERFKYFNGFMGTLMVLLPIGAYKTHNPKMIAPLVPLTLVWCYQYDMLYGNMMIRAQRNAAKTIKEEPERFFLPNNSGIVDQASYNKIIGVPEDYKPKVTEKDSIFTYMSKAAHGGK